MPRDYAKSSKKKRSYSRKPKRRSSTRNYWFIVGAAILLFAGSLWYIKTHPSKPHQELVDEENLREIAKELPKNPIKKKKKPAAVTNAKDSRFDFYTILPEMEVGKKNHVQEITKTITNDEMIKEEISQESLTPNTTTYYILQIAAFPNFADADKLKAELILIGFDANIKTVNIKGKTLNRVWLGPFNNKDTALKIQKDLREQQVKSLLLEDKR